MNRKLIWFIVIAFVFLMIVLFITNLYIDLLWFSELQYESVFWTQYLTQWGLRAAAFLFLFAVLFINLMITRRLVLRFPNLQLRERMMASGFMQRITPRRVTFFFLTVSLVLSYLFSGYAGGYWMELLRFVNAVPFNIADPIFGTDVSFYVFQLPFFRFIYGFLMMTLVLSLILVGVIYFIFSPPIRDNKFVFAPFTGLSHITALLASILALKAFDYRLQQLELVLSDRGVVYGAGYTDINANLPVLQVLMILAAAIAVLFLVNAFLRQPRLILYGLLVMISVSLLGGWAYPAAIQSFRVEPNEFVFEREYLAHNIEFTRSAYALDRMATRPYSAGETLTWEDLEQNPGTINNVRLWDYRPLMNTLNQLQAIRLYYRFNDIDIDRYRVEGDYRQVMLAAREMDKTRLAPQAQTWVNMHLQYTHGYGLTMSPVNEVSAEGLPRYFVRDIPAVTTGELELDQPAIYFGELTRDYVIANTKTPEFHYATAGDDNEFIHYYGEGGIQLDSFLKRLLFAIRLGEYRILISDELTSDSKLMFDRDIQTRTAKLAPFLLFDNDPYIVMNDGRLFWIQDAYTVSHSYPYSTPYGEYNYIRNSVKVVVDAFHGSVDFYLVEPDDPVAATFAGVFPDLFTPFEEMPQGLQQHLRYPIDIFYVQARMLMVYHATDPNVVYSREDLWQLPVEIYAGDGALLYHPAPAKAPLC